MLVTFPNYIYLYKLKIGADDRVRSDNILIGNQILYQLSYVRTYLIKHTLIYAIYDNAVITSPEIRTQIWQIMSLLFYHWIKDVISTLLIALKMNAICSQKWVRTTDRTINSRLLCHWAIWEHITLISSNYYITTFLFSQAIKLYNLDSRSSKFPSLLITWSIKPLPYQQYSDTWTPNSRKSSG